MERRDFRFGVEDILSGIYQVWTRCIAHAHKNRRNDSCVYTFPFFFSFRSFFFFSSLDHPTAFFVFSFLNISFRFYFLLVLSFFLSFFLSFTPLFFPSFLSFYFIIYLIFLELFFFYLRLLFFSFLP